MVYNGLLLHIGAAWILRYKNMIISQALGSRDCALCAEFFCEENGQRGLSVFSDKAKYFSLENINDKN